MSIESNKEAMSMLKNTLGSLENRMREAYNKGYKDGVKDGINQAMQKVADAILNEAEQTESHEIEKIVWHKDYGWIDEQADCAWK